MRNLGETAGLMVAEHYRYRMVAELAQLLIRKQRLFDSLPDKRDPALAFVMRRQFKAMTDYVGTLQTCIDAEFCKGFSDDIFTWAMGDGSEPLINVIDRWYGARANKED